MNRIRPNDPATRTTDIVGENVSVLRAAFPEAFTEGRIDFEVLKQLLGGAVDEREEKYGLNWHGKRKARQIALTPSTGTLRPCPDESVDWDTTQNLMIEGDNLEVLKLLQKSYAGKVKLIYIDPPYNTGKDFVYPDDFQDNIKNYLELTGQVDAEGRKIGTNTEASGRFHTDWLNMMYPRMKLARNLLAAGGIILVSLNDAEAPAVRYILNEVFGEENFVCQFVWNNEGNVDQQSKIKGVHEYIVAYAREGENLARPTVIDPNIEETSKLYNDQIENSITKNGPANPPSDVTLPIGFPATFQQGVLNPRDDQWPHILTPIEVKDGKVVKAGVVRSGWSSRNLLDLFLKNGCVPIADSEGKDTWFSLTHTGAIYGYKRRSAAQGHVLSVIRNVGTTKQNGNMLASWGIDFSYPKPLFLLQYLTQIFTDKATGDVVLDFFAGSGTTGHAVFAQNAADDGNRRFILVQLPEPTHSSVHRSIAAMTAARLVRASKEVRAAAPLLHPDLGFRVFKLATSNIAAWSSDRNDLPGTLEAAADHLKKDRTEQDILYELLLKRGLDLCVPIETKTIAGKTIHAIGAGVLMACLVTHISRAEVEPLALGIIAWRKELNPAGDAQVIFRDTAFVDDVAKVNLTQILCQYGFDEKAVRSI